MPRARGLPQKLHQIGAALLLSAHPVSSPTTDKPQASTTVTVTVSNNLFIETERSSPQKYRPFDAPLLPQFPTVRPRFEKLHLDDLRDSQAPAHWGLGFPVPRPQATRTIPPKTLSLKFAQKSGSGVFGTSRACACACAREAMRPFLNNGTTFTTCKPIAPQRPRPSEQSPKPPRIARAKLELGARSRSIGGRLLTRPSLARARTGEKVRHPTGQTTIARPEHGLEA